jgi:hypothetical protein
MGPRRCYRGIGPVSDSAVRLCGLARLEAVKEAKIETAPATTISGQMRLRRELSYVEQTEKSHVTASPLVDEVPDIEGRVLQPQPAQVHRPLARELNAGLRELRKQILDDVNLVPKLSKPGPCLVRVEAARDARKVRFELD